MDPSLRTKSTEDHIEQMVLHVTNVSKTAQASSSKATASSSMTFAASPHATGAPSLKASQASSSKATAPSSMTAHAPSPHVTDAPSSNATHARSSQVPHTPLTHSTEDGAAVPEASSANDKSEEYILNYLKFLKSRIDEARPPVAHKDPSESVKLLNRKFFWKFRIFFGLRLYLAAI